MLSLCCHRPLPRRARSIAPPPCLLLPYGPACHRPVGWSIRSHEEDTRPVSPGPKDLERSHPRACGVLVSVVWTRAVCPKRPQVRVDVRRCEVSGCREVPSVGADLDGEGGAVGKVENHGDRRVHPPAILDLPVLYCRYGFSDGRENRLQFVLGVGRADYLGVFAATGVLAVHPCSFGFLRTTSTLRHRASYPCLAVSPVLGPSSAGGLAGFFEQLDISHGSPRDERSPGVVFFGAFFFDGFYGDSTGVVVDQPSVEAAPSPEPHGYSLSVPLLRQIPGQRASPVRLRSPGILPLCGPVPPVLSLSSAAKLVASGRRRIEAAVEALLGSLDHKCTSVHLAPEGQVCLGYTEEGGRLHANPGTWRG